MSSDEPGRGYWERHAKRYNRSTRFLSRPVLRMLELAVEAARGKGRVLEVTTGYVHALWLDKRTGPYQIMYRRRDRPAEPAGGGDGGLDEDAGTNPAVGDNSGCGCRSSRDVGSSFVLPFVVVVGLHRQRGKLVTHRASRPR